MKKFKKNSMAAVLAILFTLATLGPVGPMAANAATTPSLGAAATYGILASTYTNTSAGTTINGGVGFTIAPAVAPLGAHPNYGSGAPYATAGINQAGALSALASQSCTFTFAPGAINLSTDTTHGPIGAYAPGVYCGTGAMDIGGPLNLNGSGTYIFRPDGALTSTDGSVVALNGASACDVFWTPTAATTLGANTIFAGTIIQPTSSAITVGANTVWTGQALAFGGTITTDTDTITVPTCAAAPASATLHVVKQIIGDNGGTVTADLFNLHVKLADADVLGSPAAGVVAPGRFYSLAAGAYAVSEDYDAAYTPSFSGDCDSSGNITLAAGDNKTCTITNTRIQMYLPPMPPCEEIFGQVISSVDHSGFHYGNIPEEWAYFTVNSPTHGDSLDNSFVQGVNPITWDLGTSTRSIRVYPSQDHGGYPTEYFNEYAVQVSSDNLNWQPAVIGATYAVNSPAAIRVHDGARDFSSTMPFRYVKISLNAISGTIGGCDFEIDAVEICSDNSGGGGFKYRTSLTPDTSGGATPIVKAKWEMNINIGTDGKYLGTDDSITAGAQFMPSGQYQVNKRITLCSIVTDPDGLADINNVYADVFYPAGVALGDSHVSLPNQSGLGCGGLMQEDALTRLSKADGLALFCDKIKNNNNNLPTFNSGYDYNEICRADGELMKETAAVYCGEKDLSYEDPSGSYTVWAVPQDKVGLQGKLVNQFEYLPLTAFEADFNSINYGNVRLNTHKIINGDLTWDGLNQGKASVRNVGNTRLAMSVNQNDMGFGKTNGLWNVRYDARVGSNASFANYDPTVTTLLADQLDLSELNEMDFSIDVNKFPPTHEGPYIGTMTLTAGAVSHLVCNVE